MKITIVLIVLACAIGGGFYAGYQWKDPVVITKVEVKEVEKVVTQTVRETITEPGGTVTVREIVRQDRLVETQSQRRESAPQQASKIPRPDWSVGVLWNPSDLPSYKPTAAELGYRVFGNVWVASQANWQQGSLTVGVRYEF